MRPRLLIGAVLVTAAAAVAVRPAAAAALGGTPATPAAPRIGGLPCLPAIWCDPGGLAGTAADAVGKAVFSGFTGWVADGATSVLGHMGGAMNQTTALDLRASWFAPHVGAMRDLAVLVLLPLVLVGLIGAVIHRDFGRLVRAAGVYVPVAVIGGWVTVEVTSLALRLTDELTSRAVPDVKASTDGAVEALLTAARSLTTPLTAGAGGLLTVVVLLLLLAGAVLIWIELLVRSAAIYAVVLFLPIGLSGLVWPATARWTRRMIEALVALILSKFVIMVVISLGAAMVADTTNRSGADKLNPLMVGATLLLLAAFAPFALLRLIPIAEAGVIGHLEGMERRPVAAAARATTTAARLVMTAAGATAGGAVDPGGGGDAASGPSTPPTPGGQLNSVRAPQENGAAPPGGAGPPVAGGGPHDPVADPGDGAGGRAGARPDQAGALRSGVGAAGDPSGSGGASDDG